MVSNSLLNGCRLVPIVSLEHACTRGTTLTVMATEF